MKRYPFSAREHQHSLELRKYALSCQLDECEPGTNAREALDQELKAIKYLMLAVNRTYDGRVSWLDGTELSMAKEVIAWADTYRASCRSANRKQ